MSAITPRTAAEVAEAVRWAIGAGAPLEVVGGGTKRAIAEPHQAAATLDLSALSGIVAYEPEELVLTLRPGTHLEEVEATLRERGQMLAFEPPRLAAVLGTTGAETFGGAFATNLAGPRRPSAGAVRDHMLGIAAVSGRGEAFKAGGRVVKNVTGYDLARALAGSWGTLAVATELTVKVLPRPETELTVVVPGLDPAAAARLMAAALGSAADVSAAAHVPADVAGGPLPAGTLLRLEGFGPSVTARRAVLERLAPGGTALDAGGSAAAWHAIRDLLPFAGGTAALWRVSVAPSAGHAVAAAAPAGSRALFDWGGGLVTLAVPPEGDAGAAAIRAAVAAAGGGHATLLRAPAAVRASVPTFEPAAPGVAALAARLRAAFDPDGVLNPGRLARTPALA